MPKRTIAGRAGGVNLAPVLWSVLFIGLIGAGGSLGYLQAVGQSNFDGGPTSAPGMTRGQSPNAPEAAADAQGLPGRAAQANGSPDSENGQVTLPSIGFERASERADQPRESGSATETPVAPAPPPGKSVDTPPKQTPASPSNPAGKSHQQPSKQPEQTGQQKPDREESADSHFFGIPVEE